MTTLKQHARQMLRRFIRIDTKSGRALDTLTVDVEGHNLLRHRPYSEIPGPKPIPLLGNTWRFLPYIGTYNKSIFRKQIVLITESRILLLLKTVVIILPSILR